MAQQTVSDFVAKRIEQIFMDVAEMVGSGEIETGDDFHPMIIFIAQSDMLSAWRSFVERNLSQHAAQQPTNG